MIVGIYRADKCGNSPNCKPSPIRPEMDRINHPQIVGLLVGLPQHCRCGRWCGLFFSFLGPLNEGSVTKTGAWSLWGGSWRWEGAQRSQWELEIGDHQKPGTLAQLLKEMKVIWGPSDLSWPSLLGLKWYRPVEGFGLAHCTRKKHWSIETTLAMFIVHFALT